MTAAWTEALQRGQSAVLRRPTPFIAACGHVWARWLCYNRDRYPHQGRCRCYPLLPICSMAGSDRKNPARSMSGSSYYLLRSTCQPFPGIRAKHLFRSHGADRQGAASGVKSPKTNRRAAALLPAVDLAL